MAQYNLAVMYSNCTGFPQDFTEAVRLHRLAANQGLALAQYNLALMYSNGTGVLQDYTEAGRLYQLAADQGHQALRDTLGQLAAACPAGTRVRITGLTTAAHLNSRLGTVVQLTKPLAAGRLAVRIDGQPKIMSMCWATVQRV
jgi:TPR repeat protein